MSEGKDSLQVRKNFVLIVYFLLLAIVEPAIFWVINTKPQGLSQNTAPLPTATNVGGGRWRRGNPS
jgi:hypothetical protein